MNVLQSYLIILIEMSCFLIFSSSFYKPEFRFKKWTRVVYVFVMATLVLIVSDVFEQRRYVLLIYLVPDSSMYYLRKIIYLYIKVRVHYI